VIGGEIYVERGNELLKKILNKGILGLSFKSKNQITLRGQVLKLSEIVITLIQRGMS